MGKWARHLSWLYGWLWTQLMLLIVKRLCVLWTYSTGHKYGMNSFKNTFLAVTPLVLVAQQFQWHHSRDLKKLRQVKYFFVEIPCGNSESETEICFQKSAAFALVYAHHVSGDNWFGNKQQCVIVRVRCAVQCQLPEQPEWSPAK